MPLPPRIADNADVLHFEIDNSAIGLFASDTIEMTVARLGGAELAPNDVTIEDLSSEPFTNFHIAGIGTNDNEDDVFRFKLGTFDDDFTITIEGEESGDTIVLYGGGDPVDNGNGSYTVPYTGSDGAEHSIVVWPGDAELFVCGEFGEEAGVVDGSDEDDLMEVDFQDPEGDEIDGADGDDDTIVGYGGDDTIVGGAGNDTIYGDNAEDATRKILVDFNDLKSGDLIGRQYDGLFITTGDQQHPGMIFDTENPTGEDTDLATDNLEEVLIISEDRDQDDPDDNEGGGKLYFFFEKPITLETLDFLDIEEGAIIHLFDSSITEFRTIEVSPTQDNGQKTEEIFENGVFKMVIELPGEGAIDNLCYSKSFEKIGDPGDDSIFGNVGDDVIFGEEGDDTIDGGDDNDFIDGGDGNDSLIGDDGDDTFAGSDGEDTIEGGRGNDTNDFTGSPLGIDVYINDEGDGSGVLSNGVGQSYDSIETHIAGEEPGAPDDSITLTTNVTDVGTISGLADTSVGTFIRASDNAVINFGGLGEPTISDVLGSGDNQGQYQIVSGDEGGQIGNITFDNFETINFRVVCFTRGTKIATIDGEVGIEDLKEGDMVQTMDHGFQPIRWIGATKVPATGRLAPVLIRKGTLGNKRDLRVSPQHRMLLSGWQMDLLFSEPEALVPAVNLVNDASIFQIEGGTVEYFHMMFDSHEIVFAEGIPSESFHPGEMGMGSFSEETREEIFGLFPELKEDLAAYGPSARSTLKAYEAKILAENAELLPRF